MAERPSTSIWFHALGAKIGGGLTYLRAVVPELAEQLEGKGTRIVLLVPDDVDGLRVPAWVEIRRLPLAARNPLTRLLFDQVVLPLWLMRQPRAVLFCSGSFSPFLQPVPTVALLRNAIYFDEVFLASERRYRRFLLRIQEWLIVRGARRCAALVYPSRAMRDLVEARHPELAPRGHVNHYGVATAFLDAGAESPARSSTGERVTFLYVMTYTLQKNLGFLLRALAIARQQGLPIRVLVTCHLESGSPASIEQDTALIAEHDLVGSGYLDPVGPKYGAELLDLYRAADACLFLSTCESFGHPLVEAMALGKPVVCSDLPFARELCGDDAIYVDLDRPESLVDIWRRWHDASGEAPRAATERVAARYSWRAHVSRLAATLRGVAPSEQRTTDS
jgi:glycosyltransferase involved in cell wall biosynthesis